MNLRIFFILLAMVVAAISQGVTDKIAPEGAPPDGCVGTAPRKFQISISEFGNSKRDVALQVSQTDCLPGSGS
jgi:hypothetical protein